MSTTDKPFKPMLSGTLKDIDQLKFPVMCSPKLDGIRCIIKDGVAVSRNLKPIPNAHIQKVLKGAPNGLDGELIVGDPTAPDVWNKTQSGVMRKDGEPDFKYHVFDFIDNCDEGCGAVSFVHRFADLTHMVESMDDMFRDEPPVVLVPHHGVATPEELVTLEDQYVADGYEGLMSRSLDGHYKFGRSTVKQGWLLKLKRWHDEEFFVAGVVELMHNDNVATKDELGHTKRSSAKAGKRGAGTLGTLTLTDKDGAIQFNVGTGFTAAERDDLWTKRESLYGHPLTVKFQEKSADGIPRFPVAVGFRHLIDLPSASME